MSTEPIATITYCSMHSANMTCTTSVSNRRSSHPHGWSSLVEWLPGRVWLFPAGGEPTWTQEEWRRILQSVAATLPPIYFLINDLEHTSSMLNIQWCNVGRTDCLFIYFVQKN